MTPAEPFGHSPEVARIVERLQAERDRHPPRPHTPTPELQARLAAIKRAAQHASWESATLGVAADILRRARHVADLEAAAALERVRQQAGESAHTFNSRHVHPPAGSGNRSSAGHGTWRPAHSSRHNADGRTPRHNFDRTVQRAAAEQRRIVEEAQRQVQLVAERLRLETNAYLQLQWLRSLHHRMAVLERSATATGVGDFATLPHTPSSAGGMATLLAPLPLTHGLPAGGALEDPGAAQEQLSRRQPANDSSARYWVEMVQCIVLATGKCQSAAEMTGRTFEEVLAATDGLGNFNSHLRGWLHHRWYRRPGR
ncbi:hypothetical protein AB0H83_08725 [Dactylosporangium sp. NPDC050688]|uniref:hypothetical protein n=1 Tax=Dactylosporangium sp. NPDC050688 TaxID=3157217 RepID=UPI0033D0B15F